MLVCSNVLSNVFLCIAGAFAIYLEPWHSDIYDSLDLRKNHGKVTTPFSHPPSPPLTAEKPPIVYRALSPSVSHPTCGGTVQEESRARDLFYGLWIPDLFMKRVHADGAWSLFCPNEAPGLADCWGEEFEALYAKYEREVPSPHASLAVPLHATGVLKISLPGAFLLDAGESQEGGTGAEPVVRHPASADRDGQPVHVVQGRVQPQEQPAESGDHQVLQPLH